MSIDHSSYQPMLTPLAIHSLGEESMLTRPDRWGNPALGTRWAIGTAPRRGSSGYAKSQCLAPGFPWLIMVNHG